MKLQELKQEEMLAVNGGSDRNSLIGILQGYANISYTDDDGETQSLNTDFGLGSLFDSISD